MGGSESEEQGTDDSAAEQAVPEAAEVREEEKIASGEISLTKSGKSLSRWQIWAEVKSFCRKANVAESKVFPHNLRRLLARMYDRYPTMLSS